VKPRYTKVDSSHYSYFFSDPNIHALTTTRSVDASFENGAGNKRNQVFHRLGFNPSQIVGASQVHGGHIQWVSDEDRGKGALTQEAAFRDTDGFLTQVPQLMISIVTADCLPLFIVEPERRLAGLLHCGWRSIRAGIIEKGIQSIRSRFQLPPETLEAVLGPALRFDDYEVGEEFCDYFKGHVRMPTGSNRFHFDLPGCVKDRLLQEGFLAENILDTELSTVQNTHDFHSFRRDGEEAGRMLSVIWSDK